MPWYVPWSESIKKRACRYLLQRYLGQFLEEKLTLDQLSVDLYNGTGTVADVSLDVQALNELGDQQNWPVELVDGYIDNISVSIPWSALLSEASYVEVQGLTVTVQPKQRDENGTSMFESMWSSMTSSMQLAQECLRQESGSVQDSSTPPEGLELFAQTIDSILSRVKVRFVDTLIRMEHVPKNSTSGVAVEINIKNMEYLDEAGNDPPVEETTEITGQEHTKTYVVSSFTTKKFYLEGVTLSTDEFPSKSRTFSRSVTQLQIAPYHKSDTDIVKSLMEELNIKDVRMTSCKNSGSSDSDPQIISDNEFHDTESSQSSEDKHDMVQINEQSNEHESVLFAKLTGRQEIRLRLKQSESVSGPKAAIEVTLGSLTTFLSPRQVQVLVELANGLASPDMEDNSNIAPKQRCVEKPMDKADYQRVEHELQQHLHPLVHLQTTGLQHTQGWSTASLDDSDDADDAEFQPMRNINAGLSDSVLSVTSSMDSSIASSASSQTSSRVTNSTRPLPSRPKRRDLESPTDVWQLELRAASLALILLHDDLLTVNAEGALALSSIRHAAHTAHSFFNNLGIFAVAGYGNKDFENASKVFEKACTLNHIRLLAAPIHLECNQKSTTYTTCMSGQITAARLELLECLMPEAEIINAKLKKKTNESQKREMYRIELLTFESDLNSSPQHNLGSKPSFKMVFKHSERPYRQFQGKKIPFPKTDVSFYLESCKSEFDLTICDRLCALLNPTPLCSPSPTTDISLQRAAVFNATNESPASEYKYDIKIECPQCVIKMRFPIPDMRPLHDMQRSPWWQRNIRPDYVTLRLEEASLTISLHSRQPATRMQLTAKVVHAYYTEADTDILIPIGKAACDEKAGYYSDNSNWPCMVILVYPLQTLGGELDESSGADSEPHCFDGLTASRIPSPFSSKRIVHESDTPHAKQQDIENGEELVIPGDSQEMSEFIEFATKSARIQIEVTFPCLSLQLISKHMYETLYNRICTDILLWEPSAPRSNIMTGYDIPATDLRESIYPAFSMCKSGIQYDSESEDSEEEGVYYSVYENRQRQKRKQALSIPPGQSTLALTFNIVKGLLAMYTPVRDSSTNVMPGQHGELVLTCDNASIFTVSGYRGNIDLGYVCVQSKLASLYHCGLLTTPSQSPPLREVGNTLPRHLQLTIYGSEEGVKRGSPQPRSLDMVKVAIRIQANHETHHMKMVRVACGINGATLHHRACPDPQSWFSEIQDMFNVDDYDVPGYEPPGVLVEFHLHLWSCAIDYRPIYLPLRAVLTMGNFSMSCNLVAQTHTSTLRFIAEDCCLLLSNRCSVNTIDLRKDYVCVVDLGLFELSVRYSDKARGNNPQVDLRVSNNVLHVRTCSDSGRALMQLITYLATDGDLIPVGEPPLTANPITNTRRASAISSTGSDTGICASEVLLNVEPPQQICDLSKSQHQHVITVLDEAMQEETKTDTNVHDDYGLPPVGVEVFFFPDEALQETGFVENTKALPQVAKDLGDMNYVPPPLPPRNSDTDDEFCILGEEVGTGFLPKHGLPEIRWLIKDPLRIIDNHFTVPLSKTDLLKAPKHFPVAVLRYTLCEMTLIWHMYGGSDFRPNINTQDKKTVNFSLDTKQDLSDYNVSRDIPGDTVSFNKSEPNTVKFSTPQKVNTNSSKWISQGGPGRNHDVLMELQLNKVRFIHEVYPENTKQASRQVLLVSEVEIRDRLASSHINKFLYQYSSESRPKQTHANMVVIKAVHLRPDPKIKAQECCLKISLLPLRLNIDQDSLLFLIDFFRELSGAPNSLDDDSTNTKPTSQTASKHNTPTHQPPVMTVNYPLQNNTSVTESIVDQQEAQLLVSENLILLAGNLPPPVEEKSFRSVNESCEESPPIYFRNVVFSPDVPIRLDYQGKRVDMSHPGGALAGLLMGLGQLNCSELRLRRLNHRHGLLGFDKLVSYALHKWLTDIKKNQLPSLLGGVGPIHALVQLFQGIRDLFWLPIEQYQKDGRIVRGLQRGANSFTTSTAMAALELTSRIIHLIQLTAETAYDMVSPGPSVRRRLHGKKGKRKRYNQPQDIREGMANAYCLVKEGLGETANTLVRVASQEHEQKGYSGAVGGVLRQIPPTVVKPIILATEATNNVLGGMVSQLVPDVRREASQKWRSDDS